MATLAENTALSADAVEQIIERYQEPAWLAEERRAALRSYEDQPFPTERDERWRYSELRRFALDGLERVQEPADPSVSERIRMRITDSDAEGVLVHKGNEVIHHEAKIGELTEYQKALETQLEKLGVDRKKLMADYKNAQSDLEAKQKLISLMEAVRAMGSFITFDQACQLPAMQQTIRFDDDSAWHGATASTWAQTPMAKLLRPWQDLVRQALHQRDLEETTRRLIWFHLTCSFNSDGQWPPTLPEAPHIIHPFNYRYCFEHLLRAELLVGGVDRTRLTQAPTEALQTILGMQQQLVADKAQRLMADGDMHRQTDANRARLLIEASRNVDSIGQSSVLQPSEYAVRADAMVEARRLVGGVEIEQVATGSEQFVDD